MFKLIKFLLTLIGLVVVAYFVMGYLGYEINKNYFTKSKEECQQRLKDCKSELIHQGIDNAQCEFDCVNPKMIVKKK